MSRFVILFLFFCVLLSPVLVVFLYKPFLMWVSLEVGTFSVMPLLFLSGSSRSVESSLKYFMVNISGSLIFLFGNLLLFHKLSVFNFSFTELGKKESLGLGSSLLFLYVPLLMKLGVFPFHFWFPEVVKGVNFVQGLLISTVQKVSPLYLIFLMKSKMSNLFVFYLVSSLSVLVGGWGGLNQTQVRKMLGFSSVSFMGWLLIVSGGSNLFSLIYLFFTYFFVSGGLFLFFHYSRLVGLSHLKKVSAFPIFSFFLVLSLFSLMGIPPFGGFSLKFFPILTLISEGYTFLFFFIFVPGTLFSLFFYLRLLFNFCFLIPPMSMSTFYSFRSKEVKEGLYSYFLGWAMSFSIFLFFYGVLVFNI